MESSGWMEERVGWFIKRSKELGMKITPQRVAIFRALTGTNDHPSAEIIHNTIIRDYPNISLTTVYRTLETFEKSGIVSVVNPLYNAARYDANTKPHDHLVCVVCKKVEDIYEESLINTDLSTKTDFKIIGYNLLINGICGDCQKNGH